MLTYVNIKSKKTILYENESLVLEYFTKLRWFETHHSTCFISWESVTYTMTASLLFAIVRDNIAVLTVKSGF